MTHEIVTFNESHVRLTNSHELKIKSLLIFDLYEHAKNAGSMSHAVVQSSRNRSKTVGLFLEQAF